MTAGVTRAKAEAKAGAGVRAEEEVRERTAACVPFCSCSCSFLSFSSSSDFRYSSVAERKAVVTTAWKSAPVNAAVCTMQYESSIYNSI